MKKIITISIIFIISTIATASLQTKRNWWEINLQKQIKQKKLIDKNKNLNNEIIIYLNHKISTSKNLLKLYKKEKFSLKYITKKFSNEEINKIISKKNETYFSYYYLKHLSTTKDKNNNLKIAKKRIINEIKSILPKNLKKFEKKISQKIYTLFFNINNLKSLSLETRILDLEKNQKRVFEHSKKRIYLNVHKKLKTNNYISNYYQIEKEIDKIIHIYYKKNSLTKFIKRHKSSLKESSTWKSLENQISTKIKNFSSIYKIAKNHKKISISHLFTYEKKPLLLDKIIFQKSHNLYLIKENYPIDKNSNIPNKIDLKPALEKMDQLRKKIISNNFIKYNQIDSKFNKIVEDSTIDTLQKFEKEKLNHSKNNNFKISYKIFLREKNLLYGYKSSSIEFINLVKNIKIKIKTNSLSNLKYRIKQNNEFIKFIKKLYLTSIKRKSNISYQKLKYTIFHTSKLISNFKKNLYITNYYFTRKKIEILKIKYLRNEHYKYLTVLQNNLFKTLKNKKIENNQLKKNQNKLSNSLLKTIAQHEIDQLYKDIKFGYKIYENFGTAKNEKIQFQKFFKKLKKDANNGNLTDDLRITIDQCSLLPLMTKINFEKISKTNKSRIFLKNEIIKSIAVLKTVISNYKKVNIIPDFLPSNNELNKLKKEINKEKNLKIGSWYLNSYNFKYIDPRAAKYLSKLFNKKAWLNNDIKQNKQKKEKIKLENISFTFIPPIGLLENPENVKNNYKEYRGINNNTTLTIFEIKNSIEELNNILYEFASKKELNPIKQKWGKKDNTNYFWISSKDKNQNIIEIFSIRYKNNILIFMGKSDKIKYNIFTKKLKKSFKSIKQS